MAERPDLELSAYAVARRPYVVQREMPVSVRFHGRSVPTQLAQIGWRFLGFPPAELVAGMVDVVHGTNFSVPPGKRAAAVLTVHDLTALRFPQLCSPASRRYPALVRAAVERGALVHVPAAFVRDELVSLLDLPSERVHVIPWGVPSVPEPTTTPPVEPPFVLALGTVEPRKDYPTLVHAFSELAAADDRLRLVVAGAEGWGSETLTRAIAIRDLEDKVIRLGYVNEDERNALLWSASVLAYPSLYEGFGFPPLEAMVAGVPVVATRAGGVPEVVGDAAVLVDAGDPSSLTAALASVLGDEGLRTELIEKGHRRAASYSWEETAERMVGLYRVAAAHADR